MKYVDGIPMTHHRLYSILQGMKQRCYNQKNQHFKAYGEKGIKICEEWIGEDGFITFYKWAISHEYNHDLTIDRIDSNDDYSPSNCIWVTPSRNSQRQPLSLQIHFAMIHSPSYECEYIEAQIEKIKDAHEKKALNNMWKSYKYNHASLRRNDHVRKTRTVQNIHIQGPSSLRGR